MNWGKAVILIFLSFATFIGVMAYKMMHTNIDLVGEDYYQKEIDYQRQIERLKSTNALTSRPIFNYSSENQSIVLKLPSAVSSGNALFFRPDNKKDDVNINLKSQSDSTIRLSTKLLKKGHWKLKVIWTDNTKEYFVENSFVK